MSISKSASVSAESPEDTGYDALAQPRSPVHSIVGSLGSVVVAFSGGVDSSVVLALAVQELGPQKVLAVTSRSETYLDEEYRTAADVAAGLGVPHHVIETKELEIPGFSSNPPDRCYHCKGELFRELIDIAAVRGFAAVADGANLDDQGDFRPGIRAADELGVRHPLMEAGLGKDAVRTLARDLGLPNWSKPAMACLSSRIPYGEAITADKLTMVARAEALLREVGYAQVRVRHHGVTARIELPADELAGLASDPTLRSRIVTEFKVIGYRYVTLDLQGFRSGSMNEVLEGKWR
ncbi:MAG: ATP-dependent sacrificial sulfur transferase LarE [Thermoleophilia bacterium]